MNNISNTSADNSNPNNLEDEHALGQVTHLALGTLEAAAGGSTVDWF
jgi:hypothetical protein